MMTSKAYNLTLLAALMFAPAFAAGAETETAGNNLSFPVIWSDGVAKTLRGDPAYPVFGGEFVPDDTDPSVLWFLQQDELNAWQADSFDAALAASPIAVDMIDWGDNLEAKDWTTNSVVRVETVLYQDLTDEPYGPSMTGFEMKHLWGDGTDEMWGTNTVQYDSAEATVYSGCARLTIQKLTGEADERALAWNAADGLWDGDAEAPDFIGGVWEGGDGPGYYSAEINIPGKVIYGYNWVVKKLHPEDTAGDYRLTFSLNPFCPEDAGVALNTSFDEATQVLIPVEEEVVAEAEDGEEGGDTGGGVGVVDVTNQLTYIDVHIVQATGSGGGGGGGKGGPGGGGGGGKGRPSR